MAKTEHYFVKFESNRIYHVFNRSIDRRPMFLSDRNCIFFLKKYDHYLSPVVKTYSFALCGNHFHFGIKIKSEAELSKFKNQENLINRFDTDHELVSYQFTRLFLSYAKAFNKEHGRVGALFQKPFKRCEVVSERRLIRMVFYHHLNGQKHKLCNDFRTYQWSSYLRYLKDGSSKLPKKEVFELMGGKEQFIRWHQNVFEEMSDDNWMIE